MKIYLAGPLFSNPKNLKPSIMKNWRMVLFSYYIINLSNSRKEGMFIFNMMKKELEK